MRLREKLSETAAVQGAMMTADCIGTHVNSFLLLAHQKCIVIYLQAICFSSQDLTGRFVYVVQVVCVLQADFLL